MLAVDDTKLYQSKLLGHEAGFLCTCHRFSIHDSVKVTVRNKLPLFNFCSILTGPLSQGPKNEWCVAAGQNACPITFSNGTQRNPHISIRLFVRNKELSVEHRIGHELVMFQQHLRRIVPAEEVIFPVLVCWKVSILDAMAVDAREKVGQQRVPQCGLELIVGGGGSRMYGFHKKAMTWSSCSGILTHDLGISSNSTAVR